MIAFDANMWIAKFDPKIRKPIDPSTGIEIDFAQERVDGLLDAANKSKTSILIPTPVLSEVLTYADKRRFELVGLIDKSSHLIVGNFDTKAAIELAEMNLSAAASDKRLGSEEPYQKIKVDRQIVAICKSHGCDTLYTTDRGLKNFAARHGIDVKHLADVPIPAGSRQMSLKLESRNDTKDE